METIHLLITGKVQGVFFRATAKDVADEAGVKGWVKNTDDGKVEIVASGTKEQLNHFVEWCRKGPKRAVVSKVEHHEIEYQAFANFQIVR